MAYNLLIFSLQSWNLLNKAGPAQEFTSKIGCMQEWTSEDITCNNANLCCVLIGTIEPGWESGSDSHPACCPFSYETRPLVLLKIIKSLQDFNCKIWTVLHIPKKHTNQGKKHPTN